MADDDELERLKRAAERMLRHRESTVIAEAEQSLATTPTSRADEGKPPAPLEFHPFYCRYKDTLLDWLDGDLFGGGHTIHLPRPANLSASLFDQSSLDPATFQPPDHLVLTRQRAWGPAPYVGDPFVYVWNCACDQHGRWVAGTQKIKYLPWSPEAFTAQRGGHRG